jgi:GntR family transcriptional regulator, transcriptional repressor for pyruvate dehydrogenase complex
MILYEVLLLNGFKKVMDFQLLSVSTIKELIGMRIAVDVMAAEFLITTVSARDIQKLVHNISQEQTIGINNLSIEEEMQF